LHEVLRPTLGSSIYLDMRGKHVIKTKGLKRWASNGRGVWILLFLFSLRAPVTNDPENRGERPWVLCPMAFLVHISHGQDLHGFFIGLVLN
jgi:hypothetical protein